MKLIKIFLKVIKNFKRNNQLKSILKMSFSVRIRYILKIKMILILKILKLKINKFRKMNQSHKLKIR